MAEDLTKLKLPELREMARERGIKPVYGINKAQLIEKLQSTEKNVQSADDKNKEKTEKAPRKATNQSQNNNKKRTKRKCQTCTKGSARIRKDQRADAENTAKAGGEPRI